MIALNEETLGAVSGETAPTTITAGGFEPLTPTTPTAPEAPTPAATRPPWHPAVYMNGQALPPEKYARFGESPNGLIEWADLNKSTMGIPGEYNAAVLMQAAGTMRSLQDDLEDIKGCLSILRRVLDGESLQNESVKAEFREALYVIETSTVHVEIVAIATNATPQDAA